MGLLLRHSSKNLPHNFFFYEAAYPPSRGGGGAYTCASFIEKNVYEVNFCWNVLIGAPGRRLYQKIINPSKVLASVKLMYYIGFN